MLAILSPAKDLDFQSPTPLHSTSDFAFSQPSQTLIEHLKRLSLVEIASLMNLSDKLSLLNYQRYQDWSYPFGVEARAAIYAFNGDVYQGLSAYSITSNAHAYLQQHVAILSGLYGVLRPFDKMLPYRLEMGTKLSVQDFNNLYSFWKNLIAPYLNQLIAQDPVPVFVNLASTEYFKAVDVSQLNYPVITPVFKDSKNGQYKIISFYAKKARGLMVRYMVDRQVTEPNQLQSFNYEGYQFSPELSSASEWVFIR